VARNARASDRLGARKPGRGGIEITWHEARRSKIQSRLPQKDFGWCAEVYARGSVVQLTANSTLIATSSCSVRRATEAIAAEGQPA